MERLIYDTDTQEFIEEPILELRIRRFFELAKNINTSADIAEYCYLKNYLRELI